jgi:hypothetical protein
VTVVTVVTVPRLLSHLAGACVRLRLRRLRATVPRPRWPFDAAGNALQIGDVVRQQGGPRGRRFRVHAVDGDTVHCFELEHGIAGRQRSFRPGDLILVERGES